MPRIIAGRFRGLKLAAPKGLETRPSADQVKEAMFSMLESLLAPDGFSGQRVLDFFGGSGALGLEALSRGAASVLICDSAAEAVACIKENSARLKNAAGVSVRRAFWPRDLKNLAGLPPFSLFLLDPPYKNHEIALKLLSEAARLSLAVPGALALWEHAPDVFDDALSPEGWALIKSRTWGRQSASIFLFEYPVGR